MSNVKDLLTTLTNRLNEFTPEARKAATYVLEHPNEISVRSIREIAQKAGVNPNTFVRLARTLGFGGYDDFREPFRDAILQDKKEFPNRARLLQSLSREGKLAGLYAKIAETTINNIDRLYAQSDAGALQAAADEILKARSTMVLGVGLSNSMARAFAYVASMALDTVSAIPNDGTLPVDALVNAGKRDVLIAMTFKPYRREVVEAVRIAVSQGVIVLGISDSMASPILAHAKHRFVIPIDTPQFFMSTVALAAFLETLMAFVIAGADKQIIAKIERFHLHRQQLGIYVDDVRKKRS